MLKISRIEYKNTDLLVISTYKEKLSISTRFILLDYLFVLFSSFSSSIFSNIKNIFSMNLKTKQLTNNGFYYFNNQFNILSINQLYLYGIRSVWKHLRFWVLPLTLTLLFIYYSFFLKSLPFAKIFSAYILIANMFYLLFSGFVFFFKKYQYRLFTSVIQRF